MKMLLLSRALSFFCGLAAASATKFQCLHQSDFDLGTYVISTPGNYKLCSNVQFAPRKPSVYDSDEDIALAFDPLVVGGDPYATNEYSLGFFAALVVAAPDVTLDLNGFTIQQDPSHAVSSILPMGTVCFRDFSHFLTL